MSVNDALARISQIQSMFSELQAGPAVQSAGSTPSSTSGTTATSGTDFATALAQAQGTYPSYAASAPVTGGAAIAGAPSVASGRLTSDQQQFAGRLAADTGLNAGVVSAWMLAEENGGAAQSRQAQNNNDWLNIGYTDSATYGSSDSVWSNPITAADATAGWLKGQNTIAGYGPASSGVQAILAAASQSPAAQIAAIQGSGWASSGYPDLPALYQQVAG